MNLAQTNIPEWSKGSDLRSDASASRVRIPLLVHNPGQTVSTALTELVSITSRITGSTARRCRLTVRTWAFEAYNSGSNPDNASFPVSQISVSPCGTVRVPYWKCCSSRNNNSRLAQLVERRSY